MTTAGCRRGKAPPPTQEREVLLADPPPIDHPAPSGLAEVFFPPADDRLDGASVGTVAGKDLQGQGSPFGRADQAAAFLRAIPPQIGAGAALCFLAGAGLSPEVGARDSGEQEREVHTEPVPVPLHPVRGRLFLGAPPLSSARKSRSLWLDGEGRPQRSSRAVRAYPFPAMPSSEACPQNLPTIKTAAPSARAIGSRPSSIHSPRDAGNPTDTGIRVTGRNQAAQFAGYFSRGSSSRVTPSRTNGDGSALFRRRLVFAAA